MIDRLEERRAIAKRIDDAARARETVNDQPEVIAARAKASEARKALDAADREFRRVFDKHSPRDDELTGQIFEDHPDLYVFEDVDSDCRWVVRCVVTGLPVFESDSIIERSVGDASYERHVVLADAVKVNGDLCLSAPVGAGNSIGEVA